MRKPRWLRALSTVLLAYLAWCIALYFGQDRLIFRRDMVRPVSPQELTWARKAEPLELDIDGGGQVYAWFLPAPQADRQHPAPVVVFCHGNAELIEHAGWFVEQYHALGCSVLLPEYRGYGKADGKPSEAAIVADAVRFYDQMVKRPDVDPKRVVFHGRSLGGGVAAQLAARRKPAALVLESTFSSVAVMAHRYLAPTCLASSPFRTDRVLSTLDIPIFIAHGTRDIVVPVEHARRLRELARNVTYIEYDCGHDLPPAGQAREHWQKLAAFLRASGVLGGPSTAPAGPARD